MAQKKLLMGCLIEQLVRIVFSTHYYEWDGALYRQVSGGPIGLRASGVVGRILMDHWVNMIHRKAKECQELNAVDPLKYESLDVKALWKYVDDCVSILKKMRLGTRYLNDKLEWRESWEQEDKEQNVTEEANTLKQFASIASSMIKCLNFTHDAPEANENGRMPVLDTEMWLGKEPKIPGIPKDMLQEMDALEEKKGSPCRVVLYNFYKKTISNKIPNLESSASPIGQKMATVSQEITRRLKNTSLDLHQDEVENNLKNYMDELIAGGFGEEFRRQALDAATKGFLKFWCSQCRGEGRINRPEAASRSLRRWKKLCGKTNWFKIQHKEPTEADGINVERTRKFMNHATRAQVEGVLAS